ncbi:uncharacterized protein LOC117241826 [Bombus vosnesenskii]|uniref:Uncharacterized protein LOC117241826 n=1 Tax=Bombus vosnesenskii TaxID=207650 RepID=A0A6J3LET7_9HYME|nr:uncharacterized protein LOC117241826 [Bombus vosnesenskii]
MDLRRKADCRKYRKWKEERAKESKGTTKEIKKRRRRKLVTDCINEGEIEEVMPKTVMKVKYRKCRKKKKRKKSKKLIRKLVKRVSFAELVLGCIKPSIEERQFLLNPRHIGCLGFSVSKMDITSESPATSQTYMSQQKSRGRKRICRKPCTERSSRRALGESESKDSECDSICSCDSRICLAGVKLTAKDKEEMKKYQREAHQSSSKTEN